IGNPPTLQFMEWGFIPSWTNKNVQTPSRYINARCETLHEKVTFKDSFRKRRCLIPASGYYEWKLIKNKKQPFYLHAPEFPILAFAVIWDSWKNSNFEIKETVAIVTKSADQFMDLQERSPIVIPSDFYAQWLDPLTPLDSLLSLLLKTQPHFTSYPVSTRVNNPKFEDSSCLQSLV
ncbi:MAG TPA: SOS response-associated peptidase, partial [Gammaproteobacteria bacterium]|nr:SOS response-associated peptidase [Gammaproteobacteria bacterium]